VLWFLELPGEEEDLGLVGALPPDVGRDWDAGGAWAWIVGGGVSGERGGRGGRGERGCLRRAGQRIWQLLREGLRVLRPPCNSNGVSNGSYGLKMNAECWRLDDAGESFDQGVEELAAETEGDG
jgi:hypothetical protein